MKCEDCSSNGDKNSHFKCEDCEKTFCGPCGNYGPTEVRCFPLQNKNVLLLDKLCKENVSKLMLANRTLKQEIEKLKEKLLEGNDKNLITQLKKQSKILQNEVETLKKTNKEFESKYGSSRNKIKLLENEHLQNIGKLNQESILLKSETKNLEPNNKKYGDEIKTLHDKMEEYRNCMKIKETHEAEKITNLSPMNCDENNEQNLVLSEILSYETLLFKINATIDTKFQEISMNLNKKFENMRSNSTSTEKGSYNSVLQNELSTVKHTSIMSDTNTSNASKGAIPKQNTQKKLNSKFNLAVNAAPSILPKPLVQLQENAEEDRFRSPFSKQNANKEREKGTDITEESTWETQRSRSSRKNKSIVGTGKGSKMTITGVKQCLQT